MDLSEQNAKNLIICVLTRTMGGVVIISQEDMQAAEPASKAFWSYVDDRGNLILKVDE